MPFDPIAYINTPRWQESRLGLERITQLLERLGRPQDRCRFVHVAGTNGKGSTCAYLASILQAAGYKTGLFTSPYIQTFEERIRVDGANITFDELTAVTLEVKQQADAMEGRTGEHPTEFELMTAVAFLHFARSGCDIAVVEVGLGGRLDSTNAIEAPEVSVIARIGLDHTVLLGTTLAAIAREKAGIIKPGVPVVSWPQDAEALQVVRDVAASQGAPLAIPDFAQLQMGEIQPGQVPLRAFRWSSLALETRLLGSYQPFNAALAVQTAQVLRQRGWNVPDSAVAQGVRAATWPGRFEVLAAPGKPAVVVDGGHNPQGAVALADSLASVFPGRKAVFVIGVLADKDYPAMLEQVLPLGSAFVAVTPDNPRALPAQKLARAIRWTGQDLLGCSACKNVRVAGGFDDALQQAVGLAGADGLVCAFGSLYSVGAVKAALRQLGYRG